MKKFLHEEYKIVWNNLTPKFFHKKVWYRGFHKNQLLMTDIIIDSFNIHAQYFTTGNLHEELSEKWKIEIRNSNSVLPNRLLASQEVSSKLTINQVEKQALSLLTEFLDYA